MRVFSWSRLIVWVLFLLSTLCFTNRSRSPIEFASTTIFCGSCKHCLLFYDIRFLSAFAQGSSLMDDSNAASPASSSSSASDSDGFNTESARLYFGPLKTPERKFVASNQRLFPPVEASPLRRSPRLSSPRPQPQPAAQFDQDSPTEESEDIELVAQLVNEVEMDDDEEEEEEDELTNSLSGTPHKGNTLPDGEFNYI